MSRATAVTDRLVLALLGLVLVAAGVLAVAWRTGWAERWWPSGPAGDGWSDRLPTLDATGLVEAPWWPWACLGAALLLVLLGLRWLVAHLPGRVDKRFTLAGSDAGGRLRVDLGAVADAAADDLAADGAVRSSSGRVAHDGRRRCVDLVAGVDPHADLRSVRRAVDATVGRLGGALGDAVPVRVRVEVARGGRERARRVA
jgi:hypothetical protein